MQSTARDFVLAAFLIALCRANAFDKLNSNDFDENDLTDKHESIGLNAKTALKTRVEKSNESSNNIYWNEQNPLFSAKSKSANSNELLPKHEANAFEEIMKVNQRDGHATSLMEGDIKPTLFRNAQRGQLWLKQSRGLYKKLVPIPYMFDKTFSKKNRRLIKEAMRVFKRHTCIRFNQIRRHRNVFVFVRNQKECSAHVGRLGSSPQLMNLLSPLCMQMGTVLHELMHVIGFYHEHQRDDRDRHVKIHYNNVMPKHKKWFRKMKLNNLVPYDYNSIMHYGKFAFAKNRSRPTITVIPERNPSPRLGGLRLSPYDIEEIKYLYQCETDTYRRCGKDFMNQTSGWFTSPNYPEDYPNQSHCTWNITVKQGRRVRLEIPTLNIEDGHYCSYDSILIHDGPTAASPQLRRLCGRRSKISVTSTGSSMFVIFSSDESINLSGFRIKFVEVLERRLINSVRILREPPVQQRILANDPDIFTVTRQLHAGMPKCTFERRVLSVNNMQSNFQLEELEVDLGAYNYPGFITIQPLCGWKQLNVTDDFDWLRRNGSTPSLRTGPTQDKTLGNGHYMYIESSSRQFNDSAFLKTYAMPASEYCIDLNYHMNGRQMGRLIVQSIENLSSNRTVKRKLFEINGDQGSQWRNTKIDFSPRTNSSNVAFRLEAYVGRSSASDIAVDDITIFPGLCGSCRNTTQQYNSDSGDIHYFSTGCVNNDLFWVRCCTELQPKFVYRRVKNCNATMFKTPRLNWYCKN